MKKIMLTALMTLYFFSCCFAQNATIELVRNNENPQQALERADSAFAEGRMFKALHIYKKHKDILHATQKTKMAICLVVKEDFQNEEAFEILKAAYEAGNTTVTPYLAKLYLEKTPYRDSSAGIQLLQKTISEDNPVGYFYMGWEYIKNSKYLKAKEFYLKAANLGNSQAMNALGILNQNGRGVPVDIKQALDWYRKSASLGNAYAPARLADYYFNDQTLNIDSALHWNLIAIHNGNRSACTRLGIAYEIGDHLPVNKEKARYYFEQSILEGDTLAEQCLVQSHIPFNAVSKADSLKSFDIIKIGAEKGFEGAQYELGRLILDGTFPDDNENAGKYWLERAAAKDNIQALCKLGRYYQFNKNDSLEAKHYFLRAAGLGYPHAMVEIFRNYPEEAYKMTNAKVIFKQLAGKSNLEEYEKYALMQFYELGIGTEKNLQKAVSLATGLYGKTSESVSPKYILRLYFEQDKFKETLHWLDIALKAESAEDSLEMGELYFYGGFIYIVGNKDIPSNERLAFQYLKKGADLGNYNCILELAKVYLSGRGVEKNVDSGMALLEKAALNDNPIAQSFLGSIYMFGSLTEKDGIKSKYWLEKAAAHGDATALNNLGECYYIGFGTDKNFEKAAFYYQQAVDKKLPMGKVSLGTLYLNGEGVTKDREKAKLLFESACNDGEKAGCEELKKL